MLKMQGMTFLAVAIVSTTIIAEQDKPKAKAPTEKDLIEFMAAKTREGIVKSRDAHAKGHGCVDGVKVVVEPTLTEKVGVFQPGKSYDAVVRFSNGSGELNVDDRQGGGQGMAVKLLLDKDTGAKLRPVVGELQFVDPKYYRSQDILGINRVPVFFVKDVQDYIIFSAAKGMAGATFGKLMKEGKTVAEAKAASEEVFKNVFILRQGEAQILKPLGVVLPEGPLAPRLREAGVLQRLSSIRMIDPLAEEYHSMVPSKYGTETVKYRLKPCNPPADPDKVAVPPGIDVANDKSYPKKVLKHHLRTEATCYKLSVLVHRQGMPDPEDAVGDWGNQQGYVDVATINIPQKKEGEELVDETLCERMSFTPWHTLPEHLPVGGIQRARERIYVEVANQRNKNIDAAEKEACKK